MPFGRYPERVGDFTKWASGLVKKAQITNSATSSRGALAARRKRRRRRRRKARKEE